MFVAEKDGNRLEVASELFLKALIAEGWTEVQPSADSEEEDEEKPKRRTTKKAQ